MKMVQRKKVLALVMVAALASQAGWAGKTEILPEQGRQTAGVYERGDVEIGWQLAGWGVRIAGKDALVGEDFRVYRAGEDRPVLDKTEPRRMQVTAHHGKIASRLQFNTKLAEVGQMRREVLATANGVSMSWTWTPFMEEGGHGEIFLGLPWDEVRTREIRVVSMEGDHVAVNAVEGEVPESLNAGITSPEIWFDHGEFVSKWRWSGPVERLRVRKTEKGAELVLRFAYHAGRRAQVRVRLRYEKAVKIRARGWEAALRGQRLYLRHGELEIVRGDFIPVGCDRGEKDLVTARTPREIIRRQEEEGGNLEIQTAWKPAGWLRRRITIGETGVEARYDGALLTARGHGEAGLLLGEAFQQAAFELRRADGSIAKLPKLPDEGYRSDPLAGLTVSLGGKKVSFVFPGEQDRPSEWRLERGADGRLELRTQFGSDRRLAGQILIRIEEQAKEE